MNTLARKLLVPAFSQLTNVRISNYFKSIVFVESRKILCRGYNFPPPFIPVFRQAKKFLNKIAIADHNGKHSYKDVLVQSHHLAERIKATLGTQLVSKCQQRIAFLCPNSVSYVVALWATWQTNNIAVPLSKFHPPSQLTYYVIDSEAALVVVTPEFFDTVKPITDKLGIPLIILDSGCDLPDIQLDEIDEYNDILKNQNAMIIYTSGTTGSPKGVVLTHFNLHAQTSCLIQSWEWSSRDVILHALPLHHVHGIVNALLCPLLVGATCVMLPKFNPSEIWKHIVDAEESEPRVNIFMGVPTMYVKLIEEYDSKFCQAGTFSRTREFIKAVCIQKVRLMVSGSAALPQPVLERWEEITGHRLLERYGMTEIGMALSNPLHGKRIPVLVIHYKELKFELLLEMFILLLVTTSSLKEIFIEPMRLKEENKRLENFWYEGQVYLNVIGIDLMLQHQLLPLMNGFKRETLPSILMVLTRFLEEPPMT
ncbi:acyl-CoA synthetase family member 3 isoform X2 [Tachypleus tridentatus]|uniref:acyl-CoA synthetase family member 3 isoform X2 n=1 Tax=Tachypleus tridentatus TaxID=6853 RepID=UPI003FD1D6EB